MNSSRIYRNTAILTALRFLEPAISLVVTMAISRHLGPSVFGAYAVLAAAINVTVVVGQLGLTTLLVREVAKRPDHAGTYLRAALTIAAMTSVAAVMALYGLKPLLRLPAAVDGLAPLASLAIFPAIAVSCFEATFTGFEKMEFVLLRSVITGVTRAALMVAAVYWRGKLMDLIIVDLITSVVSVSVCVGAFRQCRPEQHQGQVGPEMKRFLSATLPFFAMSLVTTVTSRMDVFMLTRYRNVSEVAFYVAAYKLFDLSMVLPISYIRSSFPQLSNCAHRAPEEMIRHTSKLLKDLWFYVTGAAGGLIGFGGIALLLVFGHKYDASLPVLEILALAVIPSCLGRIFSIVLIARDLQRFEFYVGAATSLTNLLLLRWLIPLYGIRGAAMSILCAMAFGSILYWICARTKLDFPIRERNVNGFIMSALGCGAVILLTGPASILRIVLGALLVAPFAISFGRKAQQRFARKEPAPTFAEHA